MSAERPPIPTDDRLPAWRRACLAYREVRQAGAGHQEAHEAVVAAVQTVLPLSWKAASAEAVNAVAYATCSSACWLGRASSFHDRNKVCLAFSPAAPALELSSLLNRKRHVVDIALNLR